MKLCLARSIFILVAIVPACGAQAADPIAVPLSGAGDTLPIHDLAAPADWSGFYAGVYGVAQTSSEDDAQLGLGVMAGVNAQFDMVLVGAEVAVEGLSDGEDGGDASAQLLGRAGLLVADDVAVYAAAGYGFDLDGSGQQEVLAGGGVELALSEGMSLRGQYLHSFPTQGDDSKDQFTLGAVFHF